MKKDKNNSAQIIANRKARHDYFIEDTYQAGLSLQGWEVKALRAGRVQLQDTYVLLKNGEAYLLGAQINALPTVSTHFVPELKRTRKLLLHKKELLRLIGLVDRSGYTLVGLDLHWRDGRVKATIGLAKGKKQHDKRAAAKDQDWQREKGRLMRDKG